MRKEAHFHEDTFKNGRWWDTVLYAVLDRDWIDVKLPDNYPVISSP